MTSQLTPAEEGIADLAHALTFVVGIGVWWVVISPRIDTPTADAAAFLDQLLIALALAGVWSVVVVLSFQLMAAVGIAILRIHNVGSPGADEEVDR